MFTDKMRQVVYDETQINSQVTHYHLG